MTDTASYPITPMASGALVDASANPDPMALNTAPVVEAFHKHGAVLIDGLDLAREAFPTFTERFVDNFIEYVGGADNDRGSALKGSNTVLQVTGGNTAKSAIPAHGEMFYTEPRPHTLFFACMRPADADGQTTIIDGIAVWNDLPDDVRALFEAQKLVYRRIYDTATWQQVYKTDSLDHLRSLCAETGVKLTEHDDGSIETVHSCHAYYDHAQGRAFVNSILTWAGREYLMGKDDSKVRFEDGSELSKDMLWAINDVCEKHTVAIPWKPGNVAMIDNFRVMHGRRSYEDTGRDIIMRMSRAQVETPAG